MEWLMELDRTVSGVKKKTTKIWQKLCKTFLRRNWKWIRFSFENMHIKSLYRKGKRDTKRKFPKPVRIQFADKIYRTLWWVRSRYSAVKSYPLANHQPEGLKDKRKKLLYNTSMLPKMWTRKIKGYKLILAKSGATYTRSSVTNIHHLRWRNQMSNHCE